MTNHPNRAGNFELVFVGGTKRPYRRWHLTFEQAQAAALKVLGEMERSDEQRNAHPAIIYGPDCGRDGVTIA